MAMFKTEDGSEIEAFTADEVKARIDAETAGMKSKLDELLGETKTAKQKARELEEAQNREAEERARERGEFKQLYENEQKARREIAEKYDVFSRQIQQRDLDAAAMSMASTLTRDTKRAELLKKEIVALSVYNEGKIVHQIGGVEVDASKVLDYVKTNYPFLTDGNGATGGGAAGSNGGRATSGKSDGTIAERTAYIARKYNL